MAVFNFPIQQPNHPAQAVRAAREMQRRWRGRRTELLEGLGIGEDDLSIGIGISSGNINFGEFGQSHRDLTAIGTVVDLPLNFHPAAIKASANCALLPNFGPPAVRLFRLYHGGGLAAPT